MHLNQDGNRFLVTSPQCGVDLLTLDEVGVAKRGKLYWHDNNNVAALGIMQSSKYYVMFTDFYLLGWSGIVKFWQRLKNESWRE